MTGSLCKRLGGRPHKCQQVDFSSPMAESHTPKSSPFCQQRSSLCHARELRVPSFKMTFQRRMHHCCGVHTVDHVGRTTPPPSSRNHLAAGRCTGSSARPDSVSGEVHQSPAGTFTRYVVTSPRTFLATITLSLVDVDRLFQDARRVAARRDQPVFNTCTPLPSYPPFPPFGQWDTPWLRPPNRRQSIKRRCNLKTGRPA